ncbi:MAG: PAS domain S-box protein [Syntrophotaleaceae bacterium]
MHFLERETSCLRRLKKLRRKKAEGMALTMTNKSSKAPVCEHCTSDLSFREGKGEAFFQSIFEHANAGMNTITIDGRYVQINPAFCRYLGYTREELRHLTVYDLTHSEDQSATRTHFAQIKAGLRQAFDYEKRFLRKDGSVVWGHVTSAWLFDEEHNPLYGIGLVQDITDRKRAEADLLRALSETRLAKDKIDGILRSLGEGLIVIDNRQCIVLMSASAEKLLGVACEQVVGRPLDALFSRRPLPPRLHEALVKGENGDQCEIELEGCPGTGRRIIQARISWIAEGGANTSGRIAVLQDVTAEREISRLKTEFINTAAHELRTPLTSIQGFSEILLIQPGLKRGERRKVYQIIHEQSEILAKLVHDLLDLSHIETGAGFRLKKTSCSPRELLDQAIRHVPRDKGRHRIEVRFPAESLEIHADPGKLRQALENILSNAVKFSPEGGIIQVDAYRRGTDLRFAVTDEGIGMNEEQVGKIFDKFFRADTSNSAVGGIGLGMNIVKEIVEAHGGRVWVNSTPGCGTTVHLSLPIGIQCVTGRDYVFGPGWGNGEVAP